MKDELLDKVYSSDEQSVPRYRLVGSDGSTVLEGVEIRLMNEILVKGTPYSKAAVLPDALAEFLGIKSQGESFDPTLADALNALRIYTRVNEDELENHMTNSNGDKPNPHGVKAEQIGAVTHKELQDALDHLDTDLTDDEFAEKMVDAIVAGDETLYNAIGMAAWGYSSDAADMRLAHFNLTREGSNGMERNVPTFDEIAGPTYRLIKSVLTTELQKEIAFENLSLDEFTLFVQIPASSELAGLCCVTFNKDGKNVWAPWLDNAVNANNKTHFSAYGRNDRGIAVLEYTNATLASATKQKYINRAPFYVEGTTPFTKVSVSHNTNLPIGTQVALWGIPYTTLSQTVAEEE